MTTLGKTIYLPSIYDPKKVRLGILEILSLVQTQELNNKAEELEEANEKSICEKAG